MTTVYKKRHGGIRRWLMRNSLSLALIGIILLSMTAGAIGCLAFLPKPQNTSTPETKTDVSTATVMQPDITNPGLTPIPAPQVFYFDVPLSEELQDYIREKCTEYEVPMELVIALIDKESSFRSDVVSTTDDYGLMQINKCNHKWLSSTLGIRNFLDPMENVLCGIYMLSDHLDDTDGNIELALMMYNCGEGGAKRLWGNGIYSTSYSHSVMTLYASYKEKAANGAATP